MNGSQRLRAALRRLTRRAAPERQRIEHTDQSWPESIETRIARLEARQQLNRYLIVVVLAEALREFMPYIVERLK